MFHKNNDFATYIYTAHAHIFEFLILLLEHLIFSIYLFAEDVLLISTKRPNIDNNNLKMNLGNLLYTQPENIKRNIRNIETTENKLASAKIMNFGKFTFRITNK